MTVTLPKDRRLPVAVPPDGVIVVTASTSLNS